MPPKFRIEGERSNGSEKDLDRIARLRLKNQQKGPYSLSNPFCGAIIENRRLTPTFWFQDVRHIVISLKREEEDTDTPDKSLGFKPGDSVAILPQNHSEKVEEFLRWMKLDPEFILSSISLNRINQTTGKGVRESSETMRSLCAVPTPITVRRLFEEFVDFDFSPKTRTVFEKLSHFASADHEKERLQYFASTEGQEDLRRYCYREKRSMRQILMDFPSCKPPLTFLLEVLQPIQPRLYSISSSASLYPHQIHLTVGLVSFKTPTKRLKMGFCSSWLSESEEEETGGVTPVQLWISSPPSSRFHLPPDEESPLILIGPGTGIAPMRAFLQERHFQRVHQQKKIGPIALFHGCRRSTCDHLYGEEFRSYVESGTLSHYFCAFSREIQQSEKSNQVIEADDPEQPTLQNSARTKYVQHLIVEQRKLVCELMFKTRGYVFISGSSASTMVKDVKEALISSIESEADLSRTDAENFIASLERSNRLCAEVWS